MGDSIELEGNRVARGIEPLNAYTSESVQLNFISSGSSGPETRVSQAHLEHQGSFTEMSRFEILPSFRSASEIYARYRLEFDVYRTRK